MCRAAKNQYWKAVYSSVHTRASTYGNHSRSLNDDLTNFIVMATIYSLSIWRNIETFSEDLLTLLLNNLRTAFILSQHIDILHLEQQKLCLSEHGTDDLCRLWLVVS